jgi:hypothetical protein
LQNQIEKDSNPLLCPTTFTNVLHGITHLRSNKAVLFSHRCVLYNIYLEEHWQLASGQQAFLWHLLATTFRDHCCYHCGDKNWETTGHRKDRKALTWKHSSFLALGFQRHPNSFKDHISFS